MQEQAPGQGSTGGNALELITKLGGLGVSAAGGALGPVLYGIGQTMANKREASKNQAANAALMQLLVPVAASMTSPGSEGSPRLGGNALALPTEPTLAGDAAGGAGAKLPETTSYSREPTRAELLQRLAGLTMQEPVRGTVLDRVLSERTRFPEDARVPVDVERARTTGERRTALTAAHPGVNVEPFTSETAARERIAPPAPTTYTQGRNVWTVPPGQGPESATVAELPRGPAEQVLFKRHQAYRSEADKMLDLEQSTGKTIPLTAWRSLINRYGDAVPKDDPIRTGLEKAEQQAAITARSEARQKAIAARQHGPRDTESITTKTTPRRPITNQEEMHSINRALPNIVSDVTNTIPGFGAAGAATVKLPSGRVVPKTQVLERAISQRLGVDARVAWDGKQFRVVKAWEPEQVLESTTTKGPRRGAAGRDEADDEE